MRHAPFPVDSTAREHWLRMMRKALNKSSLPKEVDTILWSYFEATATAMMNRE
jgi:hemoglobin